MVLACGLSCHRPVNPQAVYDHAYKVFVHGDLRQSQDEAHAARQHFQDSNPEWAWRFRILEGNSLLWRGLYRETLQQFDLEPDSPHDRNLIIEVLAIKSVAHSSLHRFHEAQADLQRANQLCTQAEEKTCGDITRAQGILAIQQGSPDIAGRFFEQSLHFARAHGDRFLEVTALINLGVAALQQQHFDECIDWTESGRKAAIDLEAAGEEQNTLGNLGWAYYRLGDLEQSLSFSSEAERRAAAAKNIVLDLYWMTNVGYVYATLGDNAKAKATYLKALDLANQTHGVEDIYDSFRALALISVENGDLDDARKYSTQAFDIAHKDNNRLDELYPLLVQGLIAARSHDDAIAENIFREVEHDPKANASLKWRSEHALAQLYEDEGRTADADREYRAALATFEAARSSLKRNDSKLPFFNNASRIYDGYINFLIAHKKPDEALRWADFSRARTLAEGLGRSSNTAFSGPPPLNAQQITRRAQGTALFYWLGEKQSYLWAITPQKSTLYPLPAEAEVEASAERYRKSLSGPQDVLVSADPDGQWLYRTLVAPAQPLLKKDAKVFVISDGKLNNLNFETLLVSNTNSTTIQASQPNTDVPKLHYWIEDATIANASSLRLLGAASLTKPKVAHSLLLIGNSVAPNEKYPELPKAAAQVESVARHFPAAQERVITREQATSTAYLNSQPEKFSYIHFVAHGTASRLSPLDSAIVLSKITPSSAGVVDEESFKLHAREIMHRPIHADLVTISACYGSGERAYTGEGLVGLSWAFLGAGAHNVVAALWEATDASTEQLMDKFYDELQQGRDPGHALRAAKLSLLQGGLYRNPFYWAPFQLYTGS